MSRLLLLAALTLLPTLAQAAPAERYDSEEGARIREDGTGTRHITIEDDETIEGESLRPGGVDIQSRVGTHHKSLISVRGEFIPQLIALSSDI